MAEYQNFLFKKEDGIAYVTVNRPKVLNALDYSVLKELDAILDDLYADNDTRCVIVTGEGKAFVAGADIAAMSTMSSAEGREFNLFAQSVFNRLEALPTPVIAAVNGYALGGGLELAMACDIRLMSETAKVGQPEVSLGIFPGFGGSQRLPRLINKGNAKYYIFTGEQMTAQRALELGLVQEVTTPENLLPRAKEVADKIASQGPIAVRLVKKVIDEGMNMPLAQGIGLEAEVSASTFASEDQTIGMKAFLAKEKPKFTNR